VIAIYKASWKKESRESRTMSTFILKAFVFLLILMGVPFTIFYLTLGYHGMPGLDVAIRMLGFYVFLFLVATGIKLLTTRLLDDNRPEAESEIRRLSGKWKLVLSTFWKIALPAILAITLGYFLPVFYGNRSVDGSIVGYLAILIVALGGALLIVAALWQRQERMHAESIVRTIKSAPLEAGVRKNQSVDREDSLLRR
jgi:hypothetical protein